MATTTSGPTPTPEQAKGVTVEEIISGTRCSPLTLKEFEGFLLHEERSVENLQFTVWYRAYCEKFKALPPEYQALSPAPEPFKQYATSSHAPSIMTAESVKTTGSGGWLRRLFKSNDDVGKVELDEEARYGGDAAKISEKYHSQGATTSTANGELGAKGPSDEDDLSLRSAAAQIMGDAPKGNQSSPFPTKARSPAAAIPEDEVAAATTTADKQDRPEMLRDDSFINNSDNASMLSDSTEKRKLKFSNLRFANMAPISSMLSRTSIDKPLPADTPLPFVEEIKLVMTTFILPGSTKELNIDARLRKHVLKYLRPAKEDGTYGEPVTTHPDVFKDVADHCYDLMEGSLPHYLQWAKGNINASKQAFWLAIGALDFGIGLMLTLVMMYYVRSRWARLAGWLFIQFGVMQFYSGSRYFCSQVHGRMARQLYPWELTSEVNAEAHQAPTSNAFVTKQEGSETNQKDKVRAELAATMPFLFEDETPAAQEQQTTTANSDHTAVAMPPNQANRNKQKKKYIFRPRWKASWKSTKGERMPVFGPERVVEDPYIKEKHNKQIREILIIGAVFVFCFEAAMVAIPEKVPL